MSIRLMRERRKAFCSTTVPFRGHMKITSSANRLTEVKAALKKDRDNRDALGILETFSADPAGETPKRKILKTEAFVTESAENGSGESR